MLKEIKLHDDFNEIGGALQTFKSQTTTKES